MSANRIRMLVVLALMAFAIPARAQTASLTGKITGAEGKPVAGAIIQALAGSTTVATATSDADGNYHLTVPSAGNYILKIRHIGYSQLTRDNLSIGGGGSSNIDFSLSQSVIQLDVVVTAASRAPEKIIDAPASVSVVSTAAVAERAAVNITDHVVAQPGIDVARGGIARSNIVARGFNNIFSGALMTLTDNRFAYVPSLRVNIPYLSTTTNEDIDHIEIVLGPGAALYGPNTASGVMSITTKSPFASPGTTVTVDGGNQSLIRGGFRTAWVLSPKIAVKASYDVFHGKEWDFVPSDTIGERQPRDRDVNRQGGEVRVDLRPTASSELIATYGRSEAGSAVEPTGLGPAQVKDWVYQTYQLRGRFKSLFAQVFMNTSDAGGTFLLTSVKPTTNCPDVTDFACVIDKSKQIAAQIQHGITFGSRQRFIYGYDFIRTVPRTEHTINGRNEDDDDITENGGYIHSVTDISDKLQLTAAARIDKHSRLEDPVFSPRVAVVFKPILNQNFRLTYNRAFSTPSTNNLFLDLVAQSNALFSIRAFGVPNAGLQFRRDCPTGIGGLCMQAFTPFGGTGAFSAANPYAGSWVAAKSGVIASLTPSFGAPTATAIANFLSSLQPTAAQVGTTLLIPKSTGGFDPTTPSALRDVERLKPEIHNKGIIGERLQLSLDVWHENRKNFVGPLILETPLVFMSRPDLNAYMTAQLTGFFTAAGQPGPVAAGTAAAVAASLSCALPGSTLAGCPGGTAVPIGVVTFDNSLIGKDAIVTYRNFGNLNLWGSDFGGELAINENFSVAGTYSYVNKNLFSKADVGGVQDISLNAPANKHSVTVRYRDESKGWGGEVRERHVDAFESLSFISAHIKQYTLFDAGVNWRPPMLDNVLFAVNATNLTNKKHQEFAQGGMIGRLIITRLTVTF
jgi:outer membrane receptor for ferrienterochelin and colicins